MQKEEVRMLSRYERWSVNKNHYVLRSTCRKTIRNIWSGVAYRWNVETSIYVHKDFRHMGIGKVLYEELEKLLKDQNVLNMNACIAYPIEEDKYLTKDSVYFHEKMGYSMVGEFHCSGYKFNRWYNMVWMEKSIGEHVENPAPVVQGRFLNLKN